MTTIADSLHILLYAKKEDKIEESTEKDKHKNVKDRTIKSRCKYWKRGF